MNMKNRNVTYSTIGDYQLPNLTLSQPKIPLGKYGRMRRNYLMEQRPVSYSTMQERLKAGNFHIALVSFAMDVCPDPGFLLMSGNTCNYVAYRSKTMDALFKKLRTQVTQADYQSVLYDIQEQFAKDCPFICLYYRGGTVLTRRMYTTTRDVREGHLLDGIESFYD